MSESNITKNLLPDNLFSEDSSPIDTFTLQKDLPP